MGGAVILIRLVLSAIAVVAGGIAAARLGDIIAVRTHLGELFFGTVLLAAGTSLPELINGLDAVRLGLPNLAAGGILGSITVNMLYLGIFDLLTLRTRLLHRVAITQSVTATLAILLLAFTVFFILAPLEIQAFGVDLEGIILLALYVVGTRLIQLDARVSRPVARAEAAEPSIPLAWAIAGFAAAVALLVVAAPVLVGSAEELAEVTGLSVGFVGLALFPLITTMPELASTTTAVRIGAYDLAVGNLFGNCVFNIFSLAFVSLFHGPEPFFQAIAPGFALVGALAILLICVALLGTLTRFELRVLGIEWDALLIILIYAGGLYLLHSQRVLQGA